MVALAVADHPSWRASDLELRSRSPSYTAATLQQFHDRGYAPSELFFIIGADAFAEIASWRDYPQILDWAHFAVVSRPGHPTDALPARSADAGIADGAPARRRRPPRPNPLIILIDAPTADVSSTAIRERRAAGESIAGLVTPGVEQHIEQHGLYAALLPAASGIPWTPADDETIRRPMRRQAGCMAKTEKRRKVAPLPRQIETAVQAAEDKKAESLVVLDLRRRPGSPTTSSSARAPTPRQIRAIADGVMEALAADGVKPAHVEGYDRSEWMLLDYFDFIVHVFAPETRLFYGLERLWGNAERIEP